MSSTAKLVMIGVIAGIVGLAVGAGAVYFNLNAKIATLESQLALGKQQLEKSDRALADVTLKYDELSSKLASAASEPPSATPVAPKPSAAPTKQFTYIKDMVNVSGTTRISADYAQILTGDAAAAAATARGDESPPPNDYYIVNENTKIRKLTVKSGIQVKLVSKDDGTINPTGYKVSLGQYLDWMSGMGGAEFEATLESAPYYITIKNGTVIAIEQVFLP